MSIRLTAWAGLLMVRASDTYRQGSPGIWRSAGELKSMFHGGAQVGRWLRGLILSAFALALVSSAAASNILCIGTDGHVALEARVAGHCTSDAQRISDRSLDRAHELVESPPCCGPCTDVDGTVVSHHGTGNTSAPRPVLVPFVHDRAFGPRAVLWT